MARTAAAAAGRKSTVVDDPEANAIKEFNSVRGQRKDSALDVIQEFHIKQINALLVAVTSFKAVAEGWIGQQQNPPNFVCRYIDSNQDNYETFVADIVCALSNWFWCLNAEYYIISTGSKFLYRPKHKDTSDFMNELIPSNWIKHHTARFENLTKEVLTRLNIKTYNVGSLEFNRIQARITSFDEIYLTTTDDDERFMQCSHELERIRELFSEIQKDVFKVIIPNKGKKNDSHSANANYVTYQGDKNELGVGRLIYTTICFIRSAGKKKKPVVFTIPLNQVSLEKAELETASNIKSKTNCPNALLTIQNLLKSHLDKLETTVNPTLGGGGVDDGTLTSLNTQNARKRNRNAALFPDEDDVYVSAFLYNDDDVGDVEEEKKRNEGLILKLPISGKQTTTPQTPRLSIVRTTPSSMTPGSGGIDSLAVAVGAPVDAGALAISSSKKRKLAETVSTGEPTPTTRQSKRLRGVNDEGAIDGGKRSCLRVDEEVELGTTSEQIPHSPMYDPPLNEVEDDDVEDDELQKAKTALLTAMLTKPAGSKRCTPSAHSTSVDTTTARADSGTSTSSGKHPTDDRRRISEIFGDDDDEEENKQEEKKPPEKLSFATTRDILKPKFAQGEKSNRKKEDHETIIVAEDQIPANGLVVCADADEEVNTEAWTNLVTNATSHVEHLSNSIILSTIVQMDTTAEAIKMFKSVLTSLQQATSSNTLVAQNAINSCLLKIPSIFNARGKQE